MPALIRHNAPSFSTAPTGGYQPGAGAQYAEAGQWNRAQYDQRRQTDLIDSGMNAFGGAAKSYFDNQGQQQRTAEARAYQQGQMQDQRQYTEAQKAAAEAKLQKHRDNFLDGLNKASPETINDPDFRPFGAAIASGAIDPAHAMAGYQAVKKSKADQAAKAGAASGTAANRDRVAVETERHHRAIETGKGRPDDGPGFDADVTDLMSLHPQVTRERAEAYIRQRNHKYATEEPANISGRKTGNQSAANAMLLTPAELTASLQGATGDVNKIGVARGELRRRGLDDKGEPNTPEAAWSSYQQAKSEYDAMPDTTGYHLPWNHPIADAKVKMDLAYQRFLNLKASTPAQPAPAQQMQQRPAADPLEAFASQHPELTPEQLYQLWKQENQ